MQRATVTINDKKKVNFVLIETGEKTGKVRRSLGIEISQVQGVTYFGEDVEDEKDFASFFPETHKALSDAGINFSNVTAIMELK
jgi:hypothetical protein